MLPVADVLAFLAALCQCAARTDEPLSDEPPSDVIEEFEECIEEEEDE